MVVLTSHERLAKVAEVLNTCTCTPHPFGDGPEIDCPMHGRSDYQAWALAPLLDEFRAEDEARALREAADETNPWSEVHHLSPLGIADWLRDRAALAAAALDAERSNG